MAGKGCLIDRCNFDANQRRDFIRLAQQLQCQVDLWLEAVQAMWYRQKEVG